MSTPSLLDSLPQPLDNAAADAVRTVYHLYDPPLWLVTAAADQPNDEPPERRIRGGCIATFVARASIVRHLPRMVAGIARHHHTWQVIETSGRFALHLLPQNSLDLVRRFGMHSGQDVDKFAGLADLRTANGSPRVAGTLAWLDCRVETSLITGDRSVYLAAVTGGGLANGLAGHVSEAVNEPPLTVGRLMELAPTEMRAELDRQYERDGVVDAEAIRAWRAQR